MYREEKMTQRLIATSLIGIALLSTIPIRAESQGTVYGKIYADWYYNATDDASLTKRSEIELSRVYLGYKFKINDSFTADALLDVGRVNAATSASATFDTTTKLVDVKLKSDERYVAFLKTAYLAWSGILPKTTLKLGQIGYFAFNVQEKFWDHRYICPSFMDKNGYASSADLGASVNVSPVDMVQITAGVTNGEGYKAPQDKYGNYKTGLGLQVNPISALTLYVYGDWMPVGSTTDTSQSTIAAFAGYNFQDLARLGVEYNAQFNQKGVQDHDVSGVSVYGMYSILKPLEIFARLDLAMSRDDWNTAQDGKAIVAGLQYSPVKQVKLAANYQRFIPSASGKQASDKIYLNCEFAY
jgi:hypothetical protein